MNVFHEDPPYCALMVLVIMFRSCWIDSDIIEVDSIVYFPACTDLDTSGASLGESIPTEWVSTWLDSIVFCTYASTLLMREAICRFFSSTVLVSLVMSWVISSSPSSMDIVSVVITDMVIKKEEVKELD